MKPGIYKDMSIEDYHANKLVVSSSGLKKVKNSTRDFIHYVTFEQEQKSCFDFGNAFELALMDRINKTRLFEEEAVVLPTEKWKQIALKEKPELKTPAASKIYKDLKREFELENFGRYLIPDVGSESFSLMDNMIKSVMSSEVVKTGLSNTDYQISLVWKDEETGVMCKTRPDVCRLNKNTIIDIKTCKDASPKGFSRDACNLDYPIQAFMQMEGAIKTGLIDSIDHYYWLAVEKCEPYNFALYRFQEQDIEYIETEYRYYLKRCAEAIKTINSFKTPDDFFLTPSYGEGADNKSGVLDFEMPLWYRG